VDDPSSQLIEALDLLGEIADEVTASRAAEELDDATLQTFWREWPRTSAWAGALWRLLNSELEQPARTADDPDLDEIGGSD
jgi:hypothetical protein